MSQRRLEPHPGITSKVLNIAGATLDPNNEVSGPAREFQKVLEKSQTQLKSPKIQMERPKIRFSPRQSPLEMYQTQLEPRTGAIGEVSIIVGAAPDAKDEV